MHSKSSVWITFIPVFWKNGHRQEIKDAAERIFNKSVNSEVQKCKNSTYIYKEKKTPTPSGICQAHESDQEQHATENNYSFLQNSKTKEKTDDHHNRRYHMGSPEIDSAKLTQIFLWQGSWFFQIREMQEVFIWTFGTVPYGVWSFDTVPYLLRQKRWERNQIRRWQR